VIRPVLVPWRRGWPLVAAVAATQTVVLAWWESWVGSWSATAAALGQALIVTGPVAAAVAAWMARAERSGGTKLLRLASSRASHVPVLRMGYECSVWAGSGMLLGVAVPVIWTARVAEFGNPPPWGWVPLAAGIFGVCLLGVSAGMRLHPHYAAAVAAVGIYGATVIGVLAGDEILAALTPYDTRATFFYATPAWVYLAQGGWFALATAAVAGALHGAGRTAGVLAVAAGMLAAPLLLVGYNDRRPDPAALEFVCATGSRVEVCMPRAKAHMLTDIVDTADEFWKLADGLVSPGARLVDEEARGIPGFDAAFAALGVDTEGAPNVPFPDISAVTRLDRAEFLGSLVGAVVGQPPAGDTVLTIPYPARPGDVLTRWFYDRLGLPLDGSGWPGAPVLDERVVDYSSAADYLEWLSDLSPDDRQRWFATYRDEIEAGTIRFDAFR